MKSTKMGGTLGVGFSQADFLSQTTLKTASTDRNQLIILGMPLGMYS